MKRLGLFVILIVIGVAAIGMLTMRNVSSFASPLPDKYRVLDSLPWDTKETKPLNFDIEQYTWLDNETICYFLHDKSGKLQATKQRVATGQTFPAEPLVNISMAGDFYSVTASPNGKSLLIRNTNANAEWECWTFPLDKGGQPQKYRTDVDGFFWLSDINSFVGFASYNGTLIRFSVKEHREEPLPFALKFRDYLIIAPNGNYYASEYKLEYDKTFRLEIGSISSRKSHMQTLPLLPGTSRFSVQSVSPTSDRLLWERLYSNDKRQKSEGNNQAEGKQEPDNMKCWYVTDTNGSHPHTVVDMEESVSPKWLPDGKHVSIVYKGALYVVPVP